MTMGSLLHRHCVNNIALILKTAWQNLKYKTSTTILTPVIVLTVISWLQVVVSPLVHKPAEDFLLSHVSNLVTIFPSTLVLQHFNFATSLTTMTGRSNPFLQGCGSWTNSDSQPWYKLGHISMFKSTFSSHKEHSYINMDQIEIFWYQLTKYFSILWFHAYAKMSISKNLSVGKVLSVNQINLHVNWIVLSSLQPRSKWSPCKLNGLHLSYERLSSYQGLKRVT